MRSERVETNERPTRARVERKEQGRGEEGETSVSVNAHGGGEREDAVGVFARTRAGTKDDAKAVGDEGEGEGEGLRVAPELGRRLQPAGQQAEDARAAGRLHPQVCG